MPYVIKYTISTGTISYLHRLQVRPNVDKYYHTFRTILNEKHGKYYFTRPEAEEIVTENGWAHEGTKVEIEFVSDEIPVLENQKREINICHS